MSATKQEALTLERQDGQLTPRPLTIEDLMSQAINTGNVEVMKETFQMWLTLKAETARETYNRKLKEFKAVCPPIKKEKAVKNKDQSLRYKYAPLEVCIRIAGPHLTDHGFSWDFDSRLSQYGQELLCTLRHEDGHSETRSATAPIDSDAHMNVDQQHGSAESYAKRRAFLNVTGLVPEGEDTDGIAPPTRGVINKAQAAALHTLLDQLPEAIQTKVLIYLQVDDLESLPTRKYELAEKTLAKALRTESEKGTVTDEQEATLIALIEGIGGTCKAEFLAAHKIKKVSELPASEYQSAVAALNQQRRAT